MTLQQFSVVPALAMTLSIGFRAVLAQDAPLYQVEKDWSMPDSIKADRLFDSASSALADGSFDPLAQPLLESAEAVSRMLFQLPTLKLAHSITNRSEDGDVMLVEWTFNEQILQGSVILRDTPLFSQYLFHLSGYTVQSLEDINTLLSKLLVLRKPPIDLTLPSLRVTVAGTAPVRGFSGTFVTPRRANESVMHFALLGTNASNDFFLSVRLGKGFTTTYYPVPPFIPERFPPLTQLVSSWSSVRLREELGRESPSTFTEFRDPIIMTELVKRGVSQELFLDLLANAGRAPLEQRAGIFFGTLIKAGQADIITRYFLPALAMYEHVGPAADNAALTLFRSALWNCPPGIDGRIVQLFKDGMFQNADLSYFEHCSSSLDSMSLVESTKVPEQLKNRKELVLRSIRERLQKQSLPLK
jgi:hypothetical protein